MMSVVEPITEPDPIYGVPRSWQVMSCGCSCGTHSAAEGYSYHEWKAASLRTLERETGWYMSRDTTTFIDTAYPPPVPTTAPALPKGVLRKGKQQIGLFVPECMR